MDRDKPSYIALLLMISLIAHLSMYIAVGIYVEQMNILSGC